ncbi:hypothetical protein JCM1841_004824 [Sporobolomyces salmonicolor]
MPPKRQRPHSPSPDASSCFEFDARVYPQAGPTPAKKKKGQPGHDEPVEKRLKLFKKACPKATEERMGRVMSQRFFCVARERTGEISEEFKVLGSTGNAYTIKIGKTPSCNCPDGMKGNHCKHILFVLLKILQVPQTSNLGVSLASLHLPPRHPLFLWYQSALLSSELRAIFAHARPAPRSQIEERVSRLYKIAMGEANAVDLEEDRGEGGSGGLVPRKRVPAKGDACPICYEDFTPKSEAGLVFCLSLQGCGNALHSECFANWARTATPVTCPLCREKWADTVPTPNAIAGPSRSSEGYANFAAQAGISGKRDTSSYYRGPRRGARWRSGYGRHGEYEFEEEDAEEWARSGYGYGN